MKLYSLRTTLAKSARLGAVLAAVACLWQPARAAAQETVDNRLDVSFTALNRFEARASGEVRVTLPWKVDQQDGQILFTELAFQSMRDYRKALSLPKWKFKIGLQDFTTIYYEGQDGFVEITDQEDLESFSLSTLTSISARPICGDTVARGSIRLTRDIWTVVSFRTGPAQPALTELLEKTDPGPQCTPFFSHDIFNDCDVYAIGGCGGAGNTSRCTNLEKTVDCDRFIYDGNCTEFEVTGPNICRCFV